MALAGNLNDTENLDTEVPRVMSTTHNHCGCAMIIVETSSSNKTDH